MLKTAIYHIGTWVLTVLVKIFFRFTHTGRERLPKNEGLILIGRHRSYWDIPFMIVAAGAKNPVAFVAKKSLLKNPLLSPFIRNYAIAIDRDHFKKEDFRKMLAVMEKEQLVGIYPEGTISETDEVRVGVVRFAERLGRDFIAFRIEADGPYPPEGFMKYSKVRASFGERFSLGDLEGSLTGSESKRERYGILAKALMERVDQVGIQKVSPLASAHKSSTQLEGRIDRG